MRRDRLLNDVVTEQSAGERQRALGCRRCRGCVDHADTNRLRVRHGPIEERRLADAWWSLDVERGAHILRRIRDGLAERV